MPDKQCLSCEATKPVSDFYLINNKPSGVCKKCNTRGSNYFAKRKLANENPQDYLFCTDCLEIMRFTTTHKTSERFDSMEIRESCKTCKSPNLEDYLHLDHWLKENELRIYYGQPTSIYKITDTRGAHAK